MMKLYFAPNACSLSPHIILCELGLPFELIRVDNKTKRTSEGGDFLEINPKGYVAVLVLDNTDVLTEGPAIVQYLADLRPELELAPSNGTWERVRLQECLNFISSEIHATCTPLFDPAIPEEIKMIFKRKLFTRFDLLSKILSDQPYLSGLRFSVADSYLFAVLKWMKVFSIDLRDWPALYIFMDRVGARPSVIQALSAEAATVPA